MSAINGQRRLINPLNFNSTTHPRSIHNTVHSSALQQGRPPCPNPRHATSKSSFYRSTHTGRLEDITSRPSGQSTVGFKLLGGFVSQRLRKLMGICVWRRRSPTVDPPVVRSAGHVVEGTICINMRPTAVILETSTDYPCKMLRKWGTVLRRRLLQ